MNWGTNELLLLPAFFVVAIVFLITMILLIRDIAGYLTRKRLKSDRLNSQDAFRKSRKLDFGLLSPVLGIIVIFLIGFILISCATQDDATGDDDDAVDDDDNADDDDDSSMDDDDDDDTIPEGAPCPNGPYDCEWTQGCHDGYCGSCENAEECHDMEGCLEDGTCGPCTLNSHCAGDEVCRHGFCMPTQIPLWEINMNPADWEAMTEDTWGENEYNCTLTAGGQTYDQDVTIRLGGCSSRLDPKKAFRITFPEDADHPGFSRKINLKSDWNDPTIMRSVLGFETFRRLTTIPTPKTRYIRLNVNGDYYGLVMEVERIGGKFLNQRGRDREQSLYEAQEINDEGAFVPVDSPAEYRFLFNKKTGNEEDYSDLIHFIEQEIWLDYLDSGTTGPSTTTRIRNSVNIDSNIENLAVMSLIENIDHVAGNFHFSFQKDETGKDRWEFYPWDLNISFGCYYYSFGEYVDCDDLYYDEWWGVGLFPNGFMAGEGDTWANLLTHLIFKDPEFKQQYDTTACAFLETPYWTQRLPNLIEAMGETIRTAVEADTNDYVDSIGDFDIAKDKLVDYLDLRKANIVDELECD